MNRYSGDCQLVKLPDGGYQCSFCGSTLSRLAHQNCPALRDRLPNYKRELGDIIEQALTKIGITKERVEEWLGGPCGCEERKEMLNRLSRWAKRILRGEQLTLEHLTDQDCHEE